jgi:Reverse transcriptase (RNA-dependent DNA polymerase)
LTHKGIDIQENRQTYENCNMTSKETTATVAKAHNGTPVNSDATNDKRYNRRGGRGRGNGNTLNTNTTKPVANLFKGGIAEMNGHTFQCYGETTEKNQYNRTLEELEVYVGAHIRHNAKDIRRMIRTMVDTTFAPPADIVEASSTATEIAIWKANIKLFMEKREWYTENKCTLYAVIWSQCSEAMQAKIKSAPTYQTMNDDANSLTLLTEIKGIAYKFESQKNIYIAINLAKKSFFATRQAPNETNSAFLTRYKDSIAVIEHYGGHIGDDAALIEEEEKKMKAGFVLPATPTATQLASCIGLAKSKSNAIYFLCCADPGRYALLTTDLENQFTRGNDQYPSNITDAYNLLVSYKKPATVHTKNRETIPTTNGGTGPSNAPTNANQQTELAFVQTSPPIEEVKCYNCNTMGHYAGSCPAPTRLRGTSASTGVQLLQSTNNDASDSNDGDHFCFHQDDSDSPDHPKISRSWILLDSESTVSIFNNKKFLKNIRHCGNEQGLRIYSNGGHQDTHMVGDLPGFGQVWYNENSLANILSLAEVRKVCRVTMDTSKAAEIIVYKHNGDTVTFSESGKGLYYYDTAATKVSTASSDYSFVSSVATNKAKYTRRQVDAADLAKRVYSLIGRPSHATFTKMIRENQLDGCPITVDDANRALKIYGPDVTALRGKTVRRQVEHIPSNQVDPVLTSILKAHGNITLCLDILFVDGLVFVTTVSRNLHFITIDNIPSRHIEKCVIPSFKKVYNVYKSRGFSIKMVHADEEFTSMRDKLLELDGIGLNIAATNEHVPEVERVIRTIKERNRATTDALPFVNYPKVMKMEMLKNAVIWLNMFPHADGVSETMSPRTIMTGVRAKFTTHCRVLFGAYCEVHNENDPSNTMRPRTSSAIALNPTGNLQGSYYFMSLATGKRISRRRWTELPYTQEVIDRVHALAIMEATYDAEVPDFQFTWGDGNPIEDYWEDNFDAGNDSDEDPDDDPDGEERPLLLNGGPAQQEPQEEGAFDAQEEDEADNTWEVGAHDAQEEDALHAQDEGAHGAENDETQEVGFETVLDETEEVPEVQDPHHYNLRGNQIDYTYKFAFTQMAGIKPKGPITNIETDLRNHVAATGFCFNQMGMKPGVKRYGEKAVEAVKVECAQMENRGVFKPVNVRDLTQDQCKRALRAITLIKEKRSGKIKGRTVVDGRGQRAYIDSDDATSPTVCTESLLISMSIDGKEKRDVATCDIEGAYLNASMEGEETVIVVYEGDMVDYMVASNPDKYGAFVHITSSGKKLLYVELLKALYGCIKSALLWYKLLASTLIDLGFELNPYDLCVANKMIDGKQCTICWYVDDLKISHVDPNVVTRVIEMIESRFGKMTVTRGDSHVYVGMNIHFPGNGEVKVTMNEYIKECVEDFPEDCTGTVRSPAAEHLFQVDEACPKIDETRRKLLHSITAKLLFVANCARPDIQLPISFLSSRVTCADEDDWRKLKRMLQYLHGTINMPLTLSIDNISVVKTWVDAAYGVHSDNMRSQTGGTIMMGKGTLYSKSSKQKINTKSSTEAELVGASDFLPQTIWTTNFIEAQGYIVGNSDFYQDNTSAMRMERNGRQSAGQRSRHINIRYFFIKDRIANGEITLIHCPTAKMIADYFTKPLQGALFVKFRDLVMGITHFSTLDAPELTVLGSVLENTGSPASTMSPDATSERKRKEEQKNPVTKTGNHITKTVTWKQDIDDGWTLVKRKRRSQQKIESNQSIVTS